jgi:hypothetical protein
MQPVAQENLVALVTNERRSESDGSFTSSWPPRQRA